MWLRFHTEILDPIKCFNFKKFIPINKKRKKMTIYYQGLFYWLTFSKKNV